MTITSRHISSLVFISIAIFLLIYTWLPARDSLQRDEARVSNIVSQPNT